MTEQEYESRFEALKEQIKSLQREYIASLPIRPGDKVKVYSKHNPELARYGVLSKVFSRWNNEDIEYTISALKKDGTVGKNNISVWYSDIVEKAD